MCVTHKSHIRTDQISTSFIITFQISSFFVFFVLHTCYPFTRAFGIWWLQDRRCWQWEKCALTVQNDRHQEREKAHWHFVCSSVFFKKTNKKKKTWSVSPTSLIFFLSLFFYMHSRLTLCCNSTTSLQFQVH